MNSSVKRTVADLLTGPVQKIIRRVNPKVALENTHQLALRAEIARLKEEIARDMPGNPVLHGYKVTSQTDEDGIIQEILGRLPAESRNRTFIEIGCGNGLENNTHFLALTGHKGCWIDGSSENIAAIREQLAPALGRASRLRVMQEFVDVANIGALLEGAALFLGTKEVEFFSLDIDGNDLFVLKTALAHITPRVICVEYNPKFPPPVAVTQRYDAAHVWSGDDYYGASLQAFVALLQDYVLVCCNLSGTNAFFVRRDFMTDFTVHPVSELYQPARAELAALKCGAESSLKWLKNALDTPEVR